jgi:UDPglucose 6-dehydrogenase
LDLKRLKALMRRPVFVDGRNVYDVDKMLGLGFEYYCIGRPDYIQTGGT